MSAQPMHHTYKAWKVSDFSGESYPLDVSAATNLSAAVEHAAMLCSHKDVFTVLHAHPVTGAGFLHVYYVEQSAKSRRVPHSDGTWRVLRPMKPRRVTHIAVNNYDPKEPWTWSPGADVVGRSNVIEGAAA